MHRFAPLPYFICWLLHVSAVLCHIQGASGSVWVTWKIQIDMVVYLKHITVRNQCVKHLVWKKLFLCVWSTLCGKTVVFCVKHVVWKNSCFCVWSTLCGKTIVFPHKVLHTLIPICYIYPINHHIDLYFSRNSDESRSSLKMADCCRNMQEPAYEIRQWCISVHCVGFSYYVW
jgi:hypothetical protein